jgi:atypical dual specificity phosphatase
MRNFERDLRPSPRGYSDSIVNLRGGRISLFGARRGHHAASSGGGSGKRDDDNDDTEYDQKNVTSIVPLLFPSLGLVLKSCLTVTFTLYILNQKHCLPKPLSAIVSQVLFWPTLPITIFNRSFRLRSPWVTIIDDVVAMGGAPINSFFAHYPVKLATQYQVTGVINMCAEYAGPVQAYQAWNISKLSLPVVDHFEPTVEQMWQAIDFIQKHATNHTKKRIYIHCRAGHGRSAAIVMAYLLWKDQQRQSDERNSTIPTNSTRDLMSLNQDLLRLRNVRSTLWRQPSIIEFHRQLLGMPPKKIHRKQGIENSARSSGQ